MRRLEQAARGVWDFVVGDDWRTALGVVVALALTALIATTALAAWWLAPIAVCAVLWLSLRRAAGPAPTRAVVAGRRRAREVPLDAAPGGASKEQPRPEREARRARAAAEGPPGPQSEEQLRAERDARRAARAEARRR